MKTKEQEEATERMLETKRKQTFRAEKQMYRADKELQDAEKRVIALREVYNEARQYYAKLRDGNV